MTDETLIRILYVEDDPYIRAIATLALEEFGVFSIAACESGAEALCRADTFRPQLLLLDVMMPGMDGPATLRRLRALTATEATPAVFMTAMSQPEEVRRFQAMGAIDVISKPFELMTLCDTVRAIWERRHVD